MHDSVSRSFYKYRKYKIYRTAVGSSSRVSSTTTINCCLRLIQVFATTMYYNRLTGTFDEHLGDNLPLIASVEDRDRVIRWVTNQRLPMFRRH